MESSASSAAVPSSPFQRPKKIPSLPPQRPPEPTPIRSARLRSAEEAALGLADPIVAVAVGGGREGRRDRTGGRELGRREKYY